MPEKTNETRIIFSGPEEMEKRRSHIKVFKNVKERPMLVEDRAEKVRNVCEMMILEGFSDELIDELLKICPDPANVETLDFLHMAVLVMGEDFVRENYVGKVITSEEACRLLREHYFNDQMKPYREIYENLDERIRAALEGEDKVSHQIEILKLQSEHASEMFEQRMANAKTQFDCDLAMAKREAEMDKERSKEQLLFMEAELKKAADRNERQKEEYEKLLKEAVLSTPRRSRRFGRKLFETKQTGDDAGKEGKNSPRSKAATVNDERREFCLATLGNQNFTGQQVDLILPCLMDEEIPLSVLKILCRPDLPAENMNGFIRFIKGGRKEDGNKGT